MDTTHAHSVGPLSAMQGRIELVDDSLTLNEEFKKNVAIPYFKDIYKDLVQWSDNKTKGINKVSVLTVSHIQCLNMVYIVFTTTWYNWRKIFLSVGFEQ
jgi:hypothetical protein